MWRPPAEVQAPFWAEPATSASCTSVTRATSVAWSALGGGDTAPPHQRVFATLASEKESPSGQQQALPRDSGAPLGARRAGD